MVTDRRTDRILRLELNWSWELQRAVALVSTSETFRTFRTVQVFSNCATLIEQMHSFEVLKKLALLPSLFEIITLLEQWNYFQTIKNLTNRTLNILKTIFWLTVFKLAINSYYWIKVSKTRVSSSNFLWKERNYPLAVIIFWEQYFEYTHHCSLTMHPTNYLYFEYSTQIGH